MVIFTYKNNTQHADSCELTMVWPK